MPQIQVLPQQATPLQQLMPYVERGLGSLAEGYGKYRTNKSDDAIMQGLNENSSPIDILKAYSSLSTERQKSIAPVMQQYVKSQQARTKEGQTLSNEEYSTIIDDLEKQLETGNTGLAAFIQSYLPGKLGAEAREGTAKFQSQSTALLGLAQRIALKQGIRNQREFQTFLDRTVPNASDTVETAKGKLEAIRSYIHGEKIPENAYKTTSEKPSLESFFK